MPQKSKTRWLGSVALGCAAILAGEAMAAMLNVAVLGENQARAVALFDVAGWQ